MSGDIQRAVIVARKRLIVNVFNLGVDQWLWKSPYCLNWIFHHPGQNIPKPNDNDSLIIVVKNENSKVVGIQNIKWNEKGQIVNKNKITYKLIKVYDFKSGSVFITNNLVLEHEIIEIVPDGGDDYFKSIKREYSQIRDLKDTQISLMKDDTFSLFKDYNVNIYKPRSIRTNSKGTLENKRQIKNGPYGRYDKTGAFDDESWVDQYESPAEKLIESIDPIYGRDPKTGKRSQQPSAIYIKNEVFPLSRLAEEGWPQYSDLIQGISYINIENRYLSNQPSILNELIINCCIEDFIYSEDYRESIKYYFDPSSEEKPGSARPKSSKVKFYDGTNLIWEYGYNNQNRLCKMTLTDKRNAVSNYFIVEYAKDFKETLSLITPTPLAITRRKAKF